MAAFVSFLSTSNRALITCVLSLWLMNWISRGWERIGRAQQFNGDWGFGLRDLATAAAIATLLAFTFFFNTRQRRTALTEKTWARILQQDSLLRSLRTGYLFTSCLTLVIFSAFYATCTFDSSAKALACLLSDIGQYEFAERAYKIAPDLGHKKASGRYSSMATWHSSDKPEDPEILLRKNAAVAAVYGSDSREMAGRYFYLGLTCIQGPMNRDGEAIFWQKKAFLLYEKNHAVTKCIDALAQMAILQLERNNAESRRLLNQAARLVPAMDEAPFVSTHIMEFLAQRNGDKEQAELFRKNLNEQKPKEDAPWWPHVTLATLAIFASGIGFTIAREFALSILTRRATQDCSKETTRHSLVNSLNKLATLNMIQGFLEAANCNSSLAVALAEGQCSMAAAQRQIDTSAKTRLSQLLRNEAFRLFLALAIAASFYV